MKKSALPLVAFILVTVRASGQDSLTVDRAVRLVMRSNPAVAQALANADAARARAEQAASLRYPDITAEAAYSRIGPVPEITFPPLGTFKFYPENNVDAHIAARFTLFDFGRTGTAVDLSRSRAESSVEAVEMTRTALAVQTIRTFYSLMLLEKSLRVQDEQIEALDGHLEATRKRVAAGTATTLDVLTTGVRAAASRNQKVEIENALEKQRTVFRQLVGMPEDAPVRVRGEFLSDSSSVCVDSLYQKASMKRTELLIARHSERSAGLQKRFAVLGRLPSLRLNLSVGSKNGYIPDLDEMRANWVAGVRAEMPLWEGGRIGHQEEEAKAQLLAEQAHLRDAERQIRSEIEQAAADVRAAQSKIRISEVQLRQAREAAIFARTKYETGSVTNLDLLDAETAESAAKLAVLQALYRSVISRVELDRAAGERFGGE
jgi:outer membrane protein